jgi:hypothetical protein
MHMFLNAFGADQRPIIFLTFAQTISCGRLYSEFALLESTRSALAICYPIPYSARSSL